MRRMTERPLSLARPHIRVAVLMRREVVQGAMARWQPWRWVLDDVTPHESGFGTAPRCLRQSEHEALWLYPDWPVELFPDDAEGYWLNATSPTPCYFVMWRLVDAEDGSEPEQSGCGAAGAGALCRCGAGAAPVAGDEGKNAGPE